MGNVTSTLTMRMVDAVTAPAKKIEASLKGVEAAAKRIRGAEVRRFEESLARRSLGMDGGVGAGTALLAGGGRMMLGAAGAYMTAGALGAGVKRAYKDYADADRAITRILITAEASADQAAKTKSTIYDIARETALPIENVTAGLDSLVAAGRTLPDAMAFLPSVARTAQAAGADVVDIAKSADALGAALKIPSDRMEDAFDKMAKAGKLGKFELKDMAQYLASLLPLAASKGFKGMEGLEKVVSYLQMIRQGTGTSEEAADSFRDMMGKLSSSETVNKFKKFGIDVKKELKKVREAGGNEFDAMFGAGGLLEQAMKKGAQVTDLFQDIQAYRGALAFKNALGDLPKYMNEVKNAAGTVADDLSRVTQDAAAGTQQLANEWDRLSRSIGQAVHNAGGTSALKALADGLDRKNKQIEAEQAKPGGGREERIRQMVERGMSKEEAERLVYADENLFDFGGAYDAVSGLFKSKSGPKQDVDAARKELEFAQRAYEKAKAAPRTTLFGYKSLTADRDEQKARERYEKAQKAWDSLFPLEDYGATPGLSEEELDRMRRSGMPQPRPRLPGEVGGIMPMPRPRPDPFNIPVQLDDASMDSEVARLRARLQSNLDSQPLVLRARVETPGMGGAVSGAMSDNGGRR